MPANDSSVGPLNATSSAKIASAGATGVIAYRSGSDREIAIITTPRVRYPQTTHIRTCENAVGNTFVARAASDAELLRETVCPEG